MYHWMDGIVKRGWREFERDFRGEFVSGFCVIGYG
ncbi:hypothetical protein HOV93_48550 [Planctomycetes bacterium FF15]|uniref:Uncharacterized protein n=1 Tax=Bremerella alba TaxID=980252 RepID=A0A7V8VAE0_9BACT|nr:hypothetical protein [Bremerella alba]